MILTVTPNPMLDKIISLARFSLGEVQRAQAMTTIAGGKGVNVSRALLALGESTLATGFLGGHTGQAIRGLLDKEGLPHHFVEIESTTREGFTFVEAESGARTAVFEPGHRITASEVNALLKMTAELLPQCTAMALCGSMPVPGFDDMYASLIRLAHQHSVPVLLDSYHEPMRLGMRAKPEFCKPNREEARATFGVDCRAAGGMRQLLHTLASQGVVGAFVTDGDRPLGATWNGETYSIKPPAIRYVNALGSGDAFVAAFLYGWVREMALEELARFAVAAGAVNASHELPGYANLQEIEELMAQIEIQRLE